MTELEQEQENSALKAEQDRKDTLKRVADEFEKTIGRISSSVTDAANDIYGSAEILSQNMQDASGTASNISQASEQAADNVGSVATAAVELSSSIDAITQQVDHSRKISNTAVEQANTTQNTVSNLVKEVNHIGLVVELISDIADGKRNYICRGMAHETKYQKYL